MTDRDIPVLKPITTPIREISLALLSADESMVGRKFRFKRTTIPAHEKVGVRVDEDGICHAETIQVKEQSVIYPVEELEPDPSACYLCGTDDPEDDLSPVNLPTQTLYVCCKCKVSSQHEQTCREEFEIERAEL